MRPPETGGQPREACDRRALLDAARTVVVKVGTYLLTRGDGGLDEQRVRALAAMLARARAGSRRLLLVSSGAIGAGLRGLGLARRPRELPLLQAAAAVGQVPLMRLYHEAFQRHGVPVAQLLLTRQDIGDRQRYLNAANTLGELFRAGVVPVINENDVVSTEEIAFGDNDTLSALVANLVQADLLLILTAVPGLLEPGDAGPRLVPLVRRVDERVRALASGETSRGGTGGMATKLQAAAAVTRAGALALIADGRLDDILDRVLAGEEVGTLFLPAGKRLSSRKRWIAFGQRPRGRIFVDAGAREALERRGKSLLPSGVLKVEGDFARGDLVAVADRQGREFARGLSNYSAAEAEQVRGLNSAGVRRALGGLLYEELVHRDNLTLTGDGG